MLGAGAFVIAASKALVLPVPIDANQTSVNAMWPSHPKMSNPSKWGIEALPISCALGRDKLWRSDFSRPQL